MLTYPHPAWIVAAIDARHPWVTPEWVAEAVRNHYEIARTYAAPPDFEAERKRATGLLKHRLSQRP